MTLHNNDRLDELQTLVAQLGNNLAASERRTTRMERIIRWGVLGILGIIALGIGANFAGDAIARQDSQAASSNAVADAIDRLNERLTGRESTLGIMGQMIQAVAMRAMSEVEEIRVMFESEDITPLGRQDCGPQNKSATQNERSKKITKAKIDYPLGFFVQCEFFRMDVKQPSEEDYQGALMLAVGGAMVDMGVLVYRIRNDSDVLRSWLADIGEDNSRVLGGIVRELNVLNGAMTSVPVMAAQMDIMNRNMSSMTYSMGSTMGRMGSLMPW